MDPRPSALQQEIRQGRPFRSRHQEAVLALLRTTDVVRRFLTRIIEPHGITLQQYNVLRILRGAGANGIPTLTIGERMIEQTPGITRLLDRLEAKGLARRKRCTEDRRQVLCWLTEPGRGLLAGLDATMDTLDDGALGMLDPAEVDALIGLLDQIRAGHAAGPPVSAGTAAAATDP
ncbi:MAG TPA: MarR family transcriptional regulator [Thermoanaerobaculia bacterium]|nr:MarR family transcriptional regulator [Thermoanaerobaculia bacterium]